MCRHKSTIFVLVFSPALCFWLCWPGLGYKYAIVCAWINKYIWFHLKICNFLALLHSKLVAMLTLRHMFSDWHCSKLINTKKEIYNQKILFLLEFLTLTTLYTPGQTRVNILISLSSPVISWNPIQLSPS